MKEIIGDDYPTYEDSVKLTLAERDIAKSNSDRLLKENFELRHRLSCIADDIEIIDRHIQKNCNKRFKRPSLNKDGSTYADEAWHNVSNIEIACDLNDDEPLYWGSKVMAEAKEAELDKLNRDL